MNPQINQVKPLQKKHIAIIGGGAAGYFTAINCAEKFPQHEVTIFEGTFRPLTKVKISGGGRCNVTHHCFDVKKLVENYPRGYRELLGSFNRFQPKDTVAWFKKRGVNLKVESDGRMFSTTNKSQTIIDCFEDSLRRVNGKILKGHKVVSIKKNDHYFEIFCHNKPSPFIADKILLATGGSPQGYALAQELGHHIIEPMPSLFTFSLKDSFLANLAGVSKEETTLTLKIIDSETSKNKTYKQHGPLLITHWGLSGPAVLKLSAFAARCLFKSNYQAQLIIDWLPSLSKEDILATLKESRTSMAKKLVMKNNMGLLTKSLWAEMIKSINIDQDLSFNQLSNEHINQIIKILKTQHVTVCAKGPFKEEFVTSGGIDLKDVNFKTMESKICSNLYFAGEILNIDGITGGFNFQNAWTSGFITAQHIGL